MTDETTDAPTPTVLGTLATADGVGVVRMEERYDTTVEDLWSALTDPQRLARWLGDVSGDLRLGGEYRFYYFASGAEGTGRIEACESPTHLLVSQSGDESDTHAIEVWLSENGSRTTLVLEERGMPISLLAAYGAGIQIHVEHLSAYLSGRELVDSRARWEQLQPVYEPLTAGLT